MFSFSAKNCAVYGRVEAPPDRNSRTGAAPPCWPAIELNRLVDLDVQARHHLPRDFGNRLLLRIIRLLVRAAKAHETLRDLRGLRFVVRELRLLRESCVIEFAPMLMPRA